MKAALNATWKFIVGIMVGIIAMGETAGRARAAAELHRQGLHKEAKALILGKDINYEG